MSVYNRRHALALGLGLALALATPHAFAQSNASGTIFGQVPVQAGTTIRIANVDTGLSRDISADSSGRYRAASLPVGRYTVTLVQGGASVATRDNVNVTIGSGSEVSFGGGEGTAGAKTLEGVQVVANALPAIDVSTTDSRTVLTSEQLQKIPVARDVTSTALLAPGVVSGDSRYGNTVSFGGSAASENAYYINGFPVTNPLTSIGLTQLPYDAIDQQQVLTGGYGAEFGRSTGGVINIITKRGGNTWKAGVAAYWSPEALEASPRNIYVPRNGTPLDGTLNRYQNDNKDNTFEYGAYISGPLVEDHLFVYATAEMIRAHDVNVQAIGVAGGYRESEFRTPRWLAKVDWNITDNHILELTGFSDKTNEQRDAYAFDYTSLTHSNVRASRTNLKNDPTVGPTGQNGADTHIAKYTGYITDNLTVTALIGKQTSQHVNLIAGSDPTCPSVVDIRPVPPEQVIKSSCQAGSVAVSDAFTRDSTLARRLDVEWRLGSHDLRAGIDNQVLRSDTGAEVPGGYAWVYQHSDDPNSPILPALGVNGAPGGNGDYVVKNFATTLANVTVKQQAQYVEDRWQIGDRYLLSIGLRNEQFSNYNSDGIAYVKQRHQLAPRLGATWDVYGDSTFKVYANAGRYHIALPNNVAVRGASGSLITQEYFAYTGVDPVTGVPTGLTPLGPGPVSANNEFGQAPDPHIVAKKGISSHYQDEYILGFDKQLAQDWNFGAKATYRNLRSAIDDFCDPRPFANWAVRNGYDPSNTDNFSCALFNPGQGGEFFYDVDGNGTLEDIKLNAKDMGYPKLKRKYLALDTYLEHPFDGRWYGRIDYTLSHSFGNDEGQLLSDLGQVDVSQVQTWDFPELMIGSNGPLPNDRRHQIKAFGYVQVTPEWLFGANLFVASGRPKNCLGINPDRDDIAAGYGSSFFYCNLARATPPEYQATPRGSRGRLPWTWRLDLSSTWRPAFAEHKLGFRADVFNVFNHQVVQNINEQFNTGATTSFAPAYGQAISYSEPRSFRLSLMYDFSL